MTLIANDVFKQLLSFRKERDWEQFHTPKNLSAALSVEVAELLEIFQWARESDLAEIIARERRAIEDEVADIAILLSYFCHDLEIDLDTAIRTKLEKNKLKYPVHLARGNSKKYDRL